MTDAAKKRCFEEVAIQFQKCGFTPYPAEGDMMKVRWARTRLCQVTPSGGVCYHRTDMKDSSFERACNQVYAISRSTFEYMGVMESAPELKASELGGDYRVLAEFNGVVLSGHPGGCERP